MVRKLFSLAHISFEISSSHAPRGALPPTLCSTQTACTFYQSFLIFTRYMTSPPTLFYLVPLIDLERRFCNSQQTMGALSDPPNCDVNNLTYSGFYRSIAWKSACQFYCKYEPVVVNNSTITLLQAEV